MSATFDAVRSRRSYSLVTPEAPSHAELLPLVAAAGRVADHAALRPWRLLELRGAARERLGAAFAAASALVGPDADRLAAKPLRAPLLLAVIASRKPSESVAVWEQDAAAAGVAHLLTLLLTDAGWGVMWRTGSHTRSGLVREVHELTADEELLGWLYVGGQPTDCTPGKRLDINAEDFLRAL